MIFKLVILFALVAGPALGSAIKGHASRSDESAAAAKGQRAPFSPIEQQKLLAAKGRHQEQAAKLEQQKLEQVKLEQPKLEQLEQQKSEELKQEPSLFQEQQLKEEKYEEPLPVAQRAEEPAQAAKGGQRFEAKPQLSRDELAKGQKKAEEKREELSKTSSVVTRVEQQKEEFKQVEQQRESLPAAPISQQKEEKFDKLDQQQRDLEGQIELREEQRRLEEPAAFVQAALPVVEERLEQIEQQRYDVKGASASAGAPLGQAEPYAFQYQIEGQSRSESGDVNGHVRGQYTLQGADGSSRIVDYVADHNGFRAEVKTNEFGTEAKSPASTSLKSSQPSAEEITLRVEGQQLLAAPSKTNSNKKETSWAAEPQLTKGGQEWARKGAAAPVQQRYSQQQEDSPAPAEQSAPLKAPAEQARGSKSVQFAEHRQAEQTRTSYGFESATAHRAFKAAPVAAARKQAPAVLVRQVASPAQSAKAPAASRSYLAASRYPASSPVANPNSRVSFYSAPATGPVSYDEEPASFIEAEQA